MYGELRRYCIREQQAILKEAQQSEQEYRKQIVMKIQERNTLPQKFHNTLFRPSSGLQELITEKNKLLEKHKVFTAELTDLKMILTRNINKWLLQKAK